MNLDFDSKINIYDKLSEIYKTKIVCVDNDNNVDVMENTLIYGGRRFLLEKMFNIAPSVQQLYTLNKVLGINDTVAVTEAEYKERKVMLFGVGIGGAGMQFGDIRVINGNHNSLVSPIPLRMVPTNADLPLAERQKYGMKKLVTVNGEPYFQYFVKLIEPNPISVRLGSTNYIPDGSANDPNSALSTEIIQIFNSSRIEISSVDIKEYFRIMNGNINNARFNELALYIAVPKQLPDPYNPGQTYMDYVAVEAFSKLTFNNKGMDSESAKYTFNYYIYT